MLLDAGQDELGDRQRHTAQEAVIAATGGVDEVGERGGVLTALSQSIRPTFGRGQASPGEQVVGVAPRPFPVTGPTFQFSALTQAFGVRLHLLAQRSPLTKKRLMGDLGDGTSLVNVADQQTGVDEGVHDVAVSRVEFGQANPAASGVTTGDGDEAQQNPENVVQVGLCAQFGGDLVRVPGQGPFHTAKGSVVGLGGDPACFRANVQFLEEVGEQGEGITTAGVGRDALDQAVLESETGGLRGTFDDLDEVLVAERAQGQRMREQLGGLTVEEVAEELQAQGRHHPQVAISVQGLAQGVLRSRVRSRSPLRVTGPSNWSMTRPVRRRSPWSRRKATSSERSSPRSLRMRRA